MSKKIVLIDSFGFFFKAHYALQRAPLINAKGQVTSVIYSYLNFIGELLIRMPADRVISIHDSRGKTFRNKLYPEYKANRSETPEELIEQISIIEELLELMGIPMVKQKGYEADDLIAHYAREANQANYKTDIFSGDKDILQLVSPSVRVIKSGRLQDAWEIMDEGEVENKYKIPLPSLSDYFALVGDSSDNVPGVRGVGPVMAAKLIKTYGTLEALYDALEELKGAVRTKLETDRDQAFLSRELIDLKETKIADLPTFEQLSEQPLAEEALAERLREYECFSLLKKFGLRATAEKKPITLRESILHREQTEGGAQGGATKKKSTQASGEASAHDPILVSRDGTALEKPMRGEDLETVEFPFEEHFTRIDVTSDADLKSCLAEIKKTKEMIFDLETTSLSAFAAEVISVAVVCGKKSYFIFCKLANPPLIAPLLEDKPFSIDLAALKEVLEDSKIKKIGHNLKYEYEILNAQGIALAGISHDTMLCEYFLDGDVGRLKLESVFRRYTGAEKSDYKALTTGQKRATIFDVPFGELRAYAMEDSEATAFIYEKQRPRLKDMPKGFKDLYTKIELPLITVLADMELAGVLIDKKYFSTLETKLRKDLEKHQKEIHSLAGEPFNINSTKQLQEILFTKLSIPQQRKTKTGYSTDSRVLEKLMDHHKIIPKLLDYRKTTKLLNTYVAVLPTLIEPKTGRIHTNYQQTGARTGRLSSNDPNLQNIPVGEDQFPIRKGFIAPKDHVLVSLDYSQVELRVLAWLSHEKSLLTAYEEGRDIHVHTASMIFEKSHEDISREERGVGKTLNFSLLYGVGAFSLAQQLKISMGEAKAFMDIYFSAYPKILTYRDAILDSARRHLYVETYYGRRRHIREIGTRDKMLQQRSERIAFNTVIQGTAADIIKIAMIAIHEAQRTEKLHAQMVMQVHDELVFYIPEAHAEREIPILAALLRNVKPFDNILEIGIESHNYWKH